MSGSPGHDDFTCCCGRARALTLWPWETFDARHRQESLDQAGAALGDEQFQQAYARGIALSFDQTISFALDELRPST